MAASKLRWKIVDGKVGCQGWRDRGKGSSQFQELHLETIMVHEGHDTHETQQRKEGDD
jgi:hypothetical protein